MSPLLKKVVRILKYLFLLLVLLFLLIVGAVNLPFVHKALTKKTNTVLHEKGIPVHFGKITLLINGKIGVRKLAIITPPNDTIIYAEKASIDLSLLPLFSKRVIINSITLKDAVINILTDTITGEINIASAFNPSEKTTTKPEVDTTSNKKQWDIKVHSIQVKNISFTYSDPAGGILVKEKIAKAEIDFDTFSLIQKQIDVGNFEIYEPVGMAAIWQGSKKAEEENGTTPAWKFSAKNLEINDLIFTLHQPDIGQRIDVTLKNGKISLDKLDLAKSEILVSEIELNKPDITFISNQQEETESENTSSTFSIPVFPWTILSEKFEIKDGSISYSTSNKIQTDDLEKWLPVHGLNARFENTQLTPDGYKLNLEKISFILAETLVIDSGSLNFTSDSLQNIGLTISLSALLNDKKGWFVKTQHLNFKTKIEGNTSVLKISEFGLLSTTGVQFNMSGTLNQPLQMPNSDCDLQFATGAISPKMLEPVIYHFSPKTVLPHFKPVTISGSLKNSISKPVFSPVQPPPIRL